MLRGHHRPRASVMLPQGLKQHVAAACSSASMGWADGAAALMAPRGYVSSSRKSSAVSEVPADARRDQRHNTDES